MKVVGTLPNEVLNKQPGRKETRALRVKRISTLQHARIHDKLLYLGQRMC